jgi:hypothetical protein
MKIKQIIIILSLVIILAVTITISRSDFIIQLNTNSNETIVQLGKLERNNIDKEVFDSLPIDKYLIIYDSTEESFTKTKDNFEKVFDYIHKEYDTVSVNEITNINNDNEYNSIILILDDIQQINKNDELMKYVFEGGSVFFSHRLDSKESFYNIYRRLGIIEFGEINNEVGIRLLDNILLKSKGVEEKEKFIQNSSLVLNLNKECVKYAETINGIPLLWEKSYGEGKILYFNGTMLYEKINRGIIVGSLSLLEEDFIYPVINTKISYLDDFPAPIPEGTHESITKEFNRDIVRFYKDIWWPDMLELGLKYNIKFTGVIIGTYDNDVIYISKDAINLTKKDFIYFGRELIANGGEIGIHGYNHQPFATKELIDKSLQYESWKDTETIIKSIDVINKLCKETFPKYEFRVYVPPSNILYPEGRKAIAQSNSDINIIGSLYITGEDTDGYEQEFEIAEDNIIEFPRLTSGYNNKDTMWTMINGITSLGVFSHFIHPDDILDNHRSHGKVWTKMLKEYDNLNKFIFDNYKWLRGMTASEGANETIKYLTCQPKYDKNENNIKIYCNVGNDNSFILRTEKSIKSSENCYTERIDDDAYLIRILKPISQINFER